MIEIAIEIACTLLSLGVVILIIIRATMLDQELFDEARSWIEWLKPWLGQDQR